MAFSASPPQSRHVLQSVNINANLSLAQEWTDYNLRWNESEYGGVKDLRITPTKLWKPDVLMYNRSVHSMPMLTHFFSLILVWGPCLIYESSGLAHVPLIALPYSCAR